MSSKGISPAHTANVAGRFVICLGLTFGAGSASAQLISADLLYHAGHDVFDSRGFFGEIGTPFAPPNFSQGIYGSSMNNTGDALIHIDVRKSGLNDALLYSPDGNGAVLSCDNELYFPSPCDGSTVPCDGNYVSDIFDADVNNSGDRASAVLLDEFDPQAYAGGVVLWNNNSAVLVDGEVVAGLTAQPIDAGTNVAINGSNQVLVSSMFDAGGGPVRALVLFDVDGTGAVTGSSVVAREGDGTWTELGVGRNAQALNDSGEVIFSGRTVTGDDGFFIDGVAAALEGDAAPGGGNWGTLVGQPCDINNTGHFVIRGVLATTTTNWNEDGDAGESSEYGNNTANFTLGSGVIDRVTGSLLDAWDVDYYYIQVTDPGSFSATTIPGGGSAGAAFDTVLALITDDPTNANGIWREGVTRNDDAADGVMQSTITGVNLPDADGYYLVISTPKVDPITRFYSHPISDQPESYQDHWNATPRDLVVHGGIFYYPDPALGAIRRVDTGTGAFLADLVVATVPDIQYSPGDVLLKGGLAIHDNGIDPARIYFNTTGSGTGNVIYSALLDGTDILPYMDSSIASGMIDAVFFQISDLDVDATGTGVYWTDSIQGEMWTADLASANITAIYDPDTSLPQTHTPEEVVVDSANGFMYWSNPLSGDINRAAMNGSGISAVASGAFPGAIAIDLAGGTLYWTEPEQNLVRSMDLTSLVVSTLDSSTEGPMGITVDASDGTVYWSSPSSKTLYRRPLAGSTAAWFTYSNTVERVCDGPGWQSNHVEKYRRVGAPGASALPYEIALTGANFMLEAVVLARDDTDVVAQSSGSLREVASGVAPVQIADNCAVMYGSSLGFMVNDTVVFDGTETIGGFPAGGASGPDTDGVYGLAMSDDGAYAVVRGFDGAFSLPPSVTPGYFVLKLALDNSGDFCAAPCVADLTTQGAGIGDPGFGEPDGLVTGADIQYYVNFWVAGDLAIADLTTQGAGIGDPGYGVPDGFVTGADIQYYVNFWVAGCP